VYLDLIYVDKHDSDFTGEWKYYRVTPISGIHIEVSEISFPSLTDKGVATQSAFIVGLASAFKVNQTLLLDMGIDQERSQLIGVRERK
jgi:hypothetical protein